jgi:hypothetical protein
MVYEAIQAGEKLAEMGINARIINMSTIKPLDEEMVLKAAKECGKIITCEEHSVIGGLGEAVCSFLSETYPTPVKRIGVNDQFGFSGPAYEVLDAFGLCARNIVDVTKEFLNRYTELIRKEIPNYIKEGKYSLTIAIGCTGGQHRSVALANEIARIFREEGRRVTLEHRELS